MTPKANHSIAYLIHQRDVLEETGKNGIPPSLKGREKEKLFIKK